jgi:signal transduction histidine kinase
MTDKQPPSAISLDRDTIVNRWLAAIAPIVPELDAAEAKSHLSAWTQQATNLLLAESLEREKARSIGEALASEISAKAQVLGKTLETLAQQLTEGLSIEQSAALQPRLIGLLSELAVGFTLKKESLTLSLRGQFLSTTSHELRSPLNAIIGFSRVIMKKVDGPITELQEQDLAAVYDGGKRLLDLINDTFDLEKIEIGEIEIELKTFDVKQLADAAIINAQPLAEEYGNTLEAHYTTDPGSMHSDPQKIRQALVNLFAHAAKFTRQGEIKLTTSRDVVDGVEWIRFQVADTGLGMTPAQVEKFAQIGNAGALEYGDLSLMVSQRYCQMLGGQITVESEVGKGTTFTISLPTRYSHE